MMGVSDPETLYVLVEKVGHGAFGSVHKGIARNGGEPIAVKVIDLEAVRDDLLEIQREITMLSRCRNPYIIEYFQSYIKGMKLWISMELMVGSAHDMMKPKGFGPFDEHSVACMAADILGGLVYLHNDGTVHRDIKAANILISAKGDVKLADLGIATQISIFRPKARSVCGTAHWMAPEVTRKEPYDWHADIFSFGVTLYELVKGEPPHTEQSGARASYINSVQPLPALMGTFSKEFKEFYSLCVRFAANDRPTAKELLKNKWIKKAKKPADFLSERIAKLERWRVKGGDDDDSESDDDHGIDVELDDDVYWDFPAGDDGADSVVPSPASATANPGQDLWSTKFKPARPRYRVKNSDGAVRDMDIATEEQL